MIINHPVLTLCNIIPIKITKYFNSDKIIIVSNICLLILHDIIIDELNKININPSSNITCIRVGIPIEGFSCTLSFRRRMYIVTKKSKQII